MADEKFSQFPAVADPSGGEIAGIKSGDNARFPTSAFATAAQGAKADGAVQSVAATNATIVVAGTADDPTVGRAAITGDISIPAGSNTATIQAGVVTNADLANVPTSTFKGRVTAATGVPEDLTVAQAKTLLNLTGTNSGDQSSIVGITGTKAQFNTALTDGDFAYTTTTDTKLTALGNRAANEGVLILCFGDSNMAGGAGTPDPTAQTANTNVLVYASGGTTPAQNPATNVTWRTVDPNAALVTDLQPGFNPYWGLRRGSSGTPDWAIADKIQKELNCPVWLVSVSMGATSSAYWLPTGGLGMDQLQLYLSAAIAAIVPPAGWTAPTKAHVVLWSEGANDVNGGLVSPTPVQAPDFVTNMKLIFDYMVVSNWAHSDALILNNEFPRTWITAANNLWLGLNYLDNQTGEYYKTVSSDGIPTEPDNIHFTPAGLNQLGLRAARMALAGIVPKVSSNQFVNGGSYVDQVGFLKVSNVGTKINLGATQNVPARPFIGITENHEWSGNNGSNTGMDLPSAFQFSGIQTITQPMEILFNVGGLFANTATFTTPAGVAPAFFGGYPTLVHRPTWQSNGANLSVNAGLGAVVAVPTILSSTSGTMTVNAVNNYASGITVGSNAAGVGNPSAITITEFVGFSAATPTLLNAAPGIAPVITRSMGVRVFNQATTGNTYSSLIHFGNNNGAGGNWSIYDSSSTAGALPSRFTGAIVLGELPAASTVGSNTWALYQYNDLPCRFNGALNTKIETIGGATASVTCGDDDHTFYFTGTAACTFNLPTATAAMQGRVYKVINSNLTAATGNPTFNSGSSNIDNGTASLVAATAAIPAGTSLSVQCVGTAGWTIV